MKERINNLVFLRNRLRAARETVVADLRAIESDLERVEANLADLQRARIDEAVAGMRRSA